MIGYSTWGNEPDVFRYSKPGRASGWNVPTVALSYVAGAFIFPVMGYMVAALSGNPDHSAAIRYFASFTTFGLAPLMMVILLTNQWAAQDGNVYVAVNGAQNVLSAIPGWRRQYTVIGIGLLAGLLILFTPNLQTTFHIITGIGAVTVPVASTIMAIDVFVLPRLFGLRRPLHRVAAWNELALGNWPAIVALLAGTVVGIYTGGLIPGTAGFGRDYIGFPAVQAWLTGGVLYLVIVAAVARSERADTVLGYARISDAHDARDEGPSAAEA
jgi:hypothetical protein